MEYQKAYYKQHRKELLEDQKARSQGYKKANRKLLWDYFESHPCVDCGEKDPIVLQSDHIDPKTKLFNIGESISSYSWSTIQAELVKCETRCANCHARRTAIQQRWYCDP